MDYKNFFNNYKDSIYSLLNNVDVDLLEKSVNLIINKNIVFIAGNGGSASIASHVSVDFLKSAKIKSSTFNNSNFITCFANDFGHENWIKEAIKSNCSMDNDLMILISSSGKSKNIINAAKYCKENKMKLITLSGFGKDNDLRTYGNVNFYVNSNDYNFVEMTHHIILVSIVDILSKKNI